MFIGRIIGAFLGYTVFGFVGAVIGFIAGHFFDRGFKNVSSPMDPETRMAVEKAFFIAVFPLLGRLAKSDGRISEEEISSVEHLMNRMGLANEDRKRAIENFQKGAEEDYDVSQCVEAFLEVCGQHNNLKQILLVYLITVAYADGVLHDNEEKLLVKVADQLGYSRVAFNHLLGMIKAQTHFYRGQQEDAGYRQGGSRGSQPTSKNEIALAYQALGVNEEIGDQELKKAYRRLMSEYHPDKLAGRGVPEDMVKLATERSQEIQSAYELLKKHRR